MSLYYLLVPLAFFIIIVAVFLPISLRFPHGNETVTQRISFHDLGRIVSVLMTAKLGGRKAVIWAPKHASRLYVQFDAKGALVEILLATKSLQNRKDRLVADLQSIDGTVRSIEQGALHVRFSGQPEAVAAQLGTAYLLTFNVESGRPLLAEVTAWKTDLLGLGLLELREYQSGGLSGEYPLSTTANANPSKVEHPLAGCLGQAAALLLKPMPFVITYSWYGIIASCWVALGVVVTSIAVRWFIKPLLPRWSNIPLKSLFWTTAPYLLVLTTGSVWFLMITPTVYCCVAGLTTIFGEWTGRSTVEPSGADYGRKGRILTLVGMVSAFVIGGIANEYIRSEYSLDFWIWYFAYFRLELIFGMLALSLPGMIVSVSHQMKKEANTADLGEKT